VTGIWFVVESAAGFYTNSLALLADAAHMLTDVAALALSLFALVISARPATHEKTYGYLRVEILAALANGVLLVLISVYIFYQAFQRFSTPPMVKSGVMLAVSVLGLTANLGAAGILYHSQHENLNVRGAFLHVLSDTLGSAGAIAAGIAMVGWGFYLADPIASVVVSVIVLYSAWKLIGESVGVLLESTPSHLNIASILADLGQVDGVVSVHDLHVWSITAGLPAMSCHVVLKQNTDPVQALRSLSRMMRDKYLVEHTTIQIEIEHVVAPEAGPR
jgi:cobalt-zinc-cadmium efflux system protein